MNNAMLSYSFFVVILIGFPMSQSASLQHENHTNSFSDKIGQLLVRRCLKNKDFDYLQHVLSSFQKAIACKNWLLPKHTEEDDLNIETRCFTFRQEALECIRELTVIIKPCLYPEEDYIPDFIIESFKPYTEYFCKNVKILTIEGLLDSNMSRCLNRFEKHQHMNPHNNCFENIMLVDHSRDAPITKDELCEDMNKIYSCYHHKFETHCPESPKAWAFEGGLLNATQTPCH